MQLTPIISAVVAIVFLLSLISGLCVSEFDLRTTLIDTQRSYGYAMGNVNLRNPAKIKSEGPASLEAKGTLLSIMDLLNHDNINLSTFIYYFNGPPANITAMSEDSVKQFTKLFEGLSNSQCQFFNQLAAVPSRMGLTTSSQLAGYRGIIPWIADIDNLQSRIYTRLSDTFTFSVSDTALTQSMINFNEAQERFRTCVSNTTVQWKGT
ncbi:hypothetical protein TWF569_006993 [Orbilia oligospora]|uniref:Uncharacterized protein n=1 Tax=Orbilia oligospora TaxID=2813651 RepID=A0A7C8NTX6_ORBOL|nr:hypothetical protein TWF102_011908 [Orbilia oligospora]KAF3091779.1 hypothetical protein TWF706_009454 [Orbilia oligospora]KAF3128037.1 hypothetical protein TWF703_009794 [Orbilia oligospora]KAF3144802.1 hypothetical protein TWF569_006993 [Orbilia oligospora]